MKSTHIDRKSKYVLLLVLILATACAPSVFPSEQSVDTEAMVQSVLEQVRADLAQQEQIVPARYEGTPAKASTAVPGEAETLQETLIRLYQQANPSVVYIVVGSSSGSGFVYDQEGHIVTNHHVVAAGRSYEVVFSSGERMRAEWVGADADSDLAMLQVDELPSGVEPLPLADAGDLQVGQLAIAIGNPFGEQGSMSLGIVSGLNRSLSSQRESVSGSSYSLPEVIQTDAPINPGNSGGPLLNLEGEVIGVNAAIASTTGTSSGVGFSIPVAAVRQIVPGLIEDGEYAYPYMGASFDEEVSLSEQSTYGVSQTQGAYVVGVTPGGPADKAGLIAANAQTGRGGDLIVDIDGQPIEDFSDLNGYLVFHTQVGQPIRITALRGQERVTLPLTLGARP